MNQHPSLSADERAAVARIIEKNPEIYQRWLARRQAAKEKQAAVLQSLPCNQSNPANKKPDASVS